MSRDVHSREVRTYRLAKTGTLFASWICLGLYNEVIGPTLQDLKARVNADYEEISRVLAARSAGLFLGSIFGGFLYDRFTKRRDLLLAVAMVLSGVTILVAPWCTQLWVLGVIFHLMGCGHGLLTTGGNPTIAFLWADTAAGPYNFLHSGFGWGAAFGPLLSQPFLSKTPNDNLCLLDRNTTDHMPLDEQTTNKPTTNVNATSVYNCSSVDPYSVLSQIEYPYMVVGILCFLVALAFLVFFMKTTPMAFVPKEQQNMKMVFHPGRCVSGDTKFGFVMLVFIFLFYMSVVGGERAYGKFIFSYAVDGELNFTKVQAIWLNAVYWISFTLARITAFVAAKWVPIYILLFIEISGTLITGILFNIFYKNVIAFWILNVSIGFFKSPLFPSCLGWANRYMEISAMTIMVVNIGSSTGGIFIQWLTGYLFEYYGPRTFLYIIIGYCVIIFCLFVIMHIIGHRHGDRFKGPRNQIAPETADDDYSLKSHRSTTSENNKAV